MSDSSVLSMTGFGAASGSIDLGDVRQIQWTWEIKSVNGKGLDLRLRLPSGFEALEASLRSSAAAVKRGNVSANLTVDDPAEGQLVVDEKVLAAVRDALAHITREIDCQAPTADGILSLRGVMTPAALRLDEADAKARDAAFLAGFERALGALASARETEGARMAAALSDQLTSLSELVRQAEGLAGESVMRQRTTLRQQISELLEGARLDEDRLIQEAAVLAVKADIREEIDRLDSHIQEARAMLAQGGVIGRRLDFLAQEFLREANTLTSKAATLELKRVGIDMKSIVDQFKEQVQNVL